MSPSPKLSELEEANDSKTRATFTGIPREVRDIIYQFALVEPISVKNFRQPSEICLSHSTLGRGGCNPKHAYHSDTRENFRALALVSRMVREEAIDMLSKRVKFSCWMPLSVGGEPRKHGIRVQKVDECVCPVLLRHGTRLQVRRDPEEVPRSFEIAIVGGVWQIKPEGYHVLPDMVRDWVKNMLRLLERHGVQGAFSKENLMALRKCLVRADEIIAGTQ
ncbi:hypothetical protein AC578_5770 [Pseudocercospora eumusae]|uniref:F-box domain-containing protein n=1 Tax=Pseudocercospora eumusae TaxID=321146 RepID=A0A139H539_9PEZI|nr:hypothetical protein AC578_5770 [Pseudocercospora eumusae]